MKRLILISISMFLLTNIIYSQDIINETGKDGKFIVRDAEQKEALIIENGNVEITGELKIVKLTEGKVTDGMVVWDKDDKNLKVVPRVFSKVSPLSEPLGTKNWHSLGYDGVDEDGNEISASVQGIAAVKWNVFNTDYGYIKLGPANPWGAHIYTNKSRFFFNKEIRTLTGKIGSHNTHLQLRTKNTTRIFIDKDNGNVGIGTTNPLSKLSVGEIGISSATIYGEASGADDSAVRGNATNSGIATNYGGYFQSAGSHGRGVFGTATNGGDGTNYGGYFRAYGSSGRAVFGDALNSDPGTNYGGYFRASGTSGRGVYGYASNNGSVTNYGGYFQSAGSEGYGVYGYASNTDDVGNFGGYFQANGGSGRGVTGTAPYSGIGTNYGGFFQANGTSGRGVYGYATNSGNVANYGGFFQADGSQGRAVYGYAYNSGNVTNYGGFFQADGSSGRGVYGTASGSSGLGVYGTASHSGGGTNYGGYFQASGSSGRGVYGTASGSSGIGVWGAATNSGSVTNYGGYFTTEGSSGRGVYGRAYGTNGKGVVGYGSIAVTSYDFDAIGPGVNYGATSSIRWKNDIVEIDRPLEKIAELRGIYFNWDEEHGGHHDVGMIAEEVGKVLPEIVVYEENGIDADGMDYSKLTPLLVEVAKAQQKLIEDLTKRIEYLESN